MDGWIYIYTLFHCSRCISCIQEPPGDRLNVVPFCLNSKRHQTMETVTRTWTKMATRCLGHSAGRQTQINKFSNIAPRIMSEPWRRILTVQSTAAGKRLYRMTHSLSLLCRRVAAGCCCSPPKIDSSGCNPLL